MTEHPILFNGPMVRAILDGRKTQTRRPVTVCWKGGRRTPPYAPYYVEEDGKLFFEDEYGSFHPMENVCPFGQPGDLLWVRETWNVLEGFECDEGYEVSGPYRKIPQGGKPNNACLVYAADLFSAESEKWRPSIHMPRWASRITLRVKSVRVERLKHIVGNDDDLKSEGMETVQYIGKRYVGDLPLIYRFSGMIDVCNGKGSFQKNPWVWVVEFERVESEAQS